MLIRRVQRFSFTNSARRTCSENPPPSYPARYRRCSDRRRLLVQQWFLEHPQLLHHRTPLRVWPRLGLRLAPSGLPALPTASTAPTDPATPTADGAADADAETDAKAEADAKGPLTGFTFRSLTLTHFRTVGTVRNALGYRLRFSLSALLNHFRVMGIR